MGIKHWNTNGLVDGNIPPGQPCPFLAKCGLKDERCPGHEGGFKLWPFSCAAARGWSMCANDERGEDT
jgi:hypothetical protein